MRESHGSVLELDHLSLERRPQRGPFDAQVIELSAR